MQGIFSRPTLAKARPTLAKEMIHFVNPFALDAEFHSMRGIGKALTQIKDNIHFPHFIQSLQEIMLSTGKKLKLIEEDKNKRITFKYKRFPKIAKDIKNHPQLEYHLKALYFLDTLKNTEGNIGMLSFINTLNFALPKGSMTKVKGIFVKKMVIKKEFKWLQTRPFWAVFTNSGPLWIWNLNLYKDFDDLRARMNEANQIKNLYHENFED